MALFPMSGRRACRYGAAEEQAGGRNEEVTPSTCSISPHRQMAVFPVDERATVDGQKKKKNNEGYNGGTRKYSPVSRDGS